MFKEMLTPQENIIAGLIVQGFSVKVIAKKLFIQECTVKSHIHSIYSKYNLVDSVKGFNDPTKRIKLLNIWNKEKYGDIDLILSQNKEVINQNKSLQNERICLMNVILTAVKDCNRCKYSKNNYKCAADGLKNALVEYTSFGGEHNV